MRGRGQGGVDDEVEPTTAHTRVCFAPSLCRGCRLACSKCGSNRGTAHGLNEYAEVCPYLDEEASRRPGRRGALRCIAGLAVEDDGSVVVSDSGNHGVQQVSPRDHHRRGQRDESCRRRGQRRASVPIGIEWTARA